MSNSSTVVVFRSDSWASPAPGVWEAQAEPRTPRGRPPFEATVTRYVGETSGWRWALYQPDTDDPGAELVERDNGLSRTLADAQRQVEHTARTWRDDPPAPGPLAGLTPCTLVACSKCGTTYTVADLAANDGRCAEPDELRFCDSQIFDGYHAHTLIEAARP